MFSKEKISNFKLCSYSSNETYRIVKYLSHYLKEFKSKILAITIGIVIVYLHVQNEEILAYIYLQHYHIAVRQFKVELQTNNQYVSFLFSWKILHFKSFSEHLLKVSLHAHNCSNLVGKMTCMGTLT